MRNISLLINLSIDLSHTLSQCYLHQSVILSAGLDSWRHRDYPPLPTIGLLGAYPAPRIADLSGGADSLG
jgi:hypothetical protein